MELKTANLLSKSKLLLLVLVVSCLMPFSSFAVFDYLYFEVNGDSTVSSMTQGDQLVWGSNCDLGATINWTIWYDVNTNGTIEEGVDVLINSENLTDGDIRTDAGVAEDGWAMVSAFTLSIEPGTYIFRATDLATGTVLKKTATVSAMVSPTNQFTGTIIIPGYTAPDPFLSNRVVFAEADLDDGGYLSITDNNGNFTINIGAGGTGLEYFFASTGVPGFADPDVISATAGGVVGGNDLTFKAAVDSVYGYVLTNAGDTLPYESNVSVNSFNGYKDALTLNGRYAIYFTADEKGEWGLEHDSYNSPFYLTEEQFNFSHDTLTSFQHDLTLTAADTVIFARITENGGLPINFYSVNCYSTQLKVWSEAISRNGSNNVVPLPASTADGFGWMISFNQFDDEFPIPAGFIYIPGPQTQFGPGDTITMNLSSGSLINGTIVQDAGDAPIDLTQVWVNAQFGQEMYGAYPDGSGQYWLYTDNKFYILHAFLDGYITRPSFRMITVAGDTSGADLNFTLNKTHCTLSGFVQGLPLPLDNSTYTITARTASGPGGVDDRYEIGIQIDSVNGAFSMQLCDGDWTIIAPAGIMGGTAPSDTVITIGEIPDTVKSLNLVYTGATAIEDEVGTGIPTHFVLAQNYPNPFNPSTDISFALPSRSHVELVIYNVLGQEVVRLLDEPITAGIHTVTWNGTDNAGNKVASGIYMYKLMTDENVETKKMVLMK